MKTLSEVVSWLETGRPRVILVEVYGVLTGSGTSLPDSILLSNTPYTTKPTDSPSNKEYIPRIQGGVSFSGNISIESDFSLSYGDIEIDNSDGLLDTWLTYIWSNKTIKVYIGDYAWSRTDFYEIFSGVIVDVSQRDQSTINLVLSDKLQKLNVAISDTLYTSTLSNDGQLKPLLLGECFNIAPISQNVQTNTLRYQYNKTASNGLIEVRDNGAPVEVTEYASTGEFELTASPYGQITCSAQGLLNGGAYLSNIADIIQYIATNSLGSASVLSIGDIDTANIQAFNTAFPYKAGIYCTDRENVLDVCNQLARSADARLIMSTQGLIKLVKLGPPSYVKSLNIVDDHVITQQDFIEDSFTIVEKLPVEASVKIGYCKNWTVQESGLAGGLPTSSVELFNTEWMYEVATNTAVATNYGIEKEPEPIETLLLSTTSASEVAAKRLELLSSPRFIYSVNCFAHKLNIGLGDTLTLYHDRFNLVSGKVGLVVQVQKDWLNGTINVGVLV